MVARGARALDADLAVQPFDVAHGITPIETDRWPIRRIGVVGRRGAAVAGRTPAHVEQRVAGRRLVAGVSQEEEELLASDVVFADREGFDTDIVLRALGVEAPALAWRTAHDEAAGRNPDHHRTFSAFLEFAVGALSRPCGCRRDGEREQQQGETAGAEPGPDHAAQAVTARLWARRERRRGRRAGSSTWSSAADGARFWRGEELSVAPRPWHKLTQKPVQPMPLAAVGQFFCRVGGREPSSAASNARCFSSFMRQSV